MIVITTPTGQIGRQVLDRVLDSGEAARVIARDPSRLSPYVRGHAEVVQGSHGDTGAITKALAGADRMFWLVPPPPFSYPGRAEHYYLDFTRPSQVVLTQVAISTRRRVDKCRRIQPLVRSLINGIWTATEVIRILTRRCGQSNVLPAGHGEELRRTQINDRSDLPVAGQPPCPGIGKLR